MRHLFDVARYKNPIKKGPMIHKVSLQNYFLLQFFSTAKE